MTIKLDSDKKIVLDGDVISHFIKKIKANGSKLPFKEFKSYLESLDHSE